MAGKKLKSSWIAKDDGKKIQIGGTNEVGWMGAFVGDKDAHGGFDDTYTTSFWLSSGVFQLDEENEVTIVDSNEAKNWVSGCSIRCIQE